MRKSRQSSVVSTTITKVVTEDAEEGRPIWNSSSLVRKPPKIKAVGGSAAATLWGVVFRYILIWVGDWYRDGQKGPATVMSKSPFKLKILYGELNEEVLAAQSVVIQKAGHEVKTAVGRKGVEEAMGKASFDLVVLGQTLTRNDRHHLPYMVKKNHKDTRVLVMHTDGERHPYVDANIDTGSSMETLISKISAAFAADAVAAGR